MREEVKKEVLSIESFDSLEQEHIQNVLEWIDSGVEIFRIEKPATPPKHLVSYFVLVDGDNVLLVDHKKAELWLPAGGHVEKDEHPRTTVEREVKEELFIEANFLYEKPLLLTVTETVGKTAGHYDVSLWYVLRGDKSKEVQYDENEFNGVRWFDFDEIPLERADPHMGRFIQKLRESI